MKTTKYCPPVTIFDVLHDYEARGGDLPADVEKWWSDETDAVMRARLTELAARDFCRAGAWSDPRGGEDISGDLEQAAAALLAAPEREAPARPRIVCLCGSTRFTLEMACLAWALERDKGYIVLGWHLLPDNHPDVQGPFTDGHAAENAGRKEHFDELHLRKIDLADEVLVLNVGGYIGESTRREIAYAEAHDKPVHYLEPLARLAGGDRG